MLYSLEERVVQRFFGRLAGRKLSDEEVKEIVGDIHRVAEFVRDNKDVQKMLGVDRPKRPSGKTRKTSV